MSWCEGSGGGGGGGMPLVLMMRGHVGAAACSRLYEHFGWGTPHSALKAYSASTGLRSYKKNAHRCVPTGPPPRPLWSHRDNKQSCHGRSPVNRSAPAHRSDACCSASSVSRDASRPASATSAPTRLLCRTVPV